MALGSEDVWKVHVPNRPYPTGDYLLLLLGATEEQQRVAAADVAELGYDR